LKNRLPAVGLILLLSSCVSTDHYRKVDNEVLRGNYQNAYASLESSKKAYREKDRILYCLDLGMLAHYAGNYRESSELLETGERAIEEAYSKSVIQAAGTFLVNDMTQEYSGEDYEDVYLNVFNALNYYHQGLSEDALVEIRRLNNKLQFLAGKYGLMITNLQKAAMENSSDIPFDPSTVTVNFTNSALARYLGMLFYRGQGRWDDARIDRDQVKIAFANQPGVYQFGLPSTLDEELDYPRGKTRLNVVAFTGLSPIKSAEELRIPFTSSNWVKISLPVINARPSNVGSVDVVLDSGEQFDLEPIEDISAVAQETFKQKAGVIYLRSSIRAITKAATAAALSDSRRSDASVLLGFLTQVYAEVSEQADLRISRYFPGRALVGGITLDPGTYSYTVNFYDHSGSIIQSDRFLDVEIRNQGLNLTEALCLK
jgi:hypothetical protein